MFEAKQLAALFAIAAGGFINAGIGLGTAPSATPAGAARLVTESPSDPQLQLAAEQALLAQLRADLGDASATLRLSALHFERASGRTVEGRGEAIARFDGGAPVPLEVSIAFDLPTQRVEQAAYLVSGPAQTLRLDQATRRRIADRIGSRLVVEFAGQPVDFALGRVEHLAAGHDKLLVSGEGVASFQGEGSARTRFVATTDRASGKLLSLQYELGEQIAE
ncbi:MAG: hypothetical protein ABI588_00410 [Arenimonas sp.]